MEGYDYTKCIEVSKRVRWDIDKDVIRAVSLIYRRNSFRTASLKEATLVGHEMEILTTYLDRPANKAIAATNVARRRAIDHTGHRSFARQRPDTSGALPPAGNTPNSDTARSNRCRASQRKYAVPDGFQGGESTKGDLRSDPGQ